MWLPVVSLLAVASCGRARFDELPDAPDPQPPDVLPPPDYCTPMLE